MRKYYQTVTEFDDSKFKPMPKPIGYMNSEKNAEQMRANLWSMFDLPHTPEKRAELIKESNRTPEIEFGLSVTDYGWTSEVKEAFYAHPYHKALVKKLKPGGMGFFALQAEPCDIDE